MKDDPPESCTQQPAPRLRVLTFGAFRLLTLVEREWKEVHSRELTEQGPPLTMLKILLCCGSPLDSHQRPGGVTGATWERHEASRDLLIRSLWSNAQTRPLEPENSLHKAKCVLNGVLHDCAGGDVVLRSGGTDKVVYALNPRCLAIDADEFEALIWQASAAEGRSEAAAALWEQAYGLVQGEFLPHDLSAEWARKRRKRLHVGFRLALHRLAEHYQQAARYGEVVTLLHPYALAHPADEDALLRLVPALAEQGRYTEALELCESCKRTLKANGARPSQELLDLEQELRQGQQAARARTIYVVSSSRRKLVVPLREGELMPSAAASSPLAGAGESWFDVKRRAVEPLVAQEQGRAAYCQELRALIDQELAMFDQVQTLYTASEYTVSRRQALAALMTIPAALLASVREPLPPPLALEEFLPRCAAANAACRKLMNSDGLQLAEQKLSTYLPALIEVARQPTRYQATAAQLATEGCEIAGVLALHRNDLTVKESYNKQAVEWSYLTEDHNVQVLALRLLARTYSYDGKHSANMLEALQRAEPHLLYISPLLHSSFYATQALAYAQQKQEQETLRSIGLASTQSMWS